MNFQRITNFLFNIYNDKKLLLVSIFFVSLLVSSLFLVFLGKIGPEGHQLPNTDYLNCYKPSALNFLQGKGIFENNNGEICSPPGYPFFLAPILKLSQLLKINEISLIVLVNVILAAFSALLLFLFTELLFGRKIALISSLLWLSYPFNLWFLKNPQTETIFIPFLYLAVWIFLMSLRKKTSSLTFLTGIILGAATLTRPVAVFLPFLFVLLGFLFFPFKKQILLSCLILAGFLLVIFPWEMALFSKTQNFVFLDSRGSEPVSVGFTFPLRETEGMPWPKIPDNILNLMEEIKAQNPKNMTGLFGFFMSEFKDKPLAFLELIGLKMARSWYATSQMWWEEKIVLVQLPYLLSALFGIILAIRKQRDKIKNIIFLLGIVISFWGITTLSLSILRYMIPSMGLIIIFSALFLNFYLDKLLKIKGMKTHE